MDYTDSAGVNRLLKGRFIMLLGDSTTRVLYSNLGGDVGVMGYRVRAIRWALLLSPLTLSPLPNQHTSSRQRLPAIYAPTIISTPRHGDVPAPGKGRGVGESRPMGMR